MFNGSKRLPTTFSVREFGYRGAFRLDVAARTDLLAQVENRPYLYRAATLAMIFIHVNYPSLLQARLSANSRLRVQKQYSSQDWQRPA